MSVEGRGWVTCVGIDLVNWQQEEPAGFDGRRQPSMGGTSRMSREAHVRICERLGVQLPGPTRLTLIWAFVRNLRTWLVMARKKAAAVAPRGRKYRCASSGADCSVLVVKRGNARGTKGAGHLR